MAAAAAKKGADVSSARRLLELLELGRAGAASVQAALESWLPRLEAGPDCFRPASAAARARLEAAKSTPRGLPLGPALRQLALRLSAAAGVDEEQCLALVESYLFEAPVRELDAADAVLAELLDYYHDERLCLVQCLASLLRSASDDAHPYHAFCAAHARALLDRGLERKVADRFRVAAERAAGPAPAPAASTQPRAQALRAAGHALGEQAAHLDVLFLLFYARPAPPTAEQVLSLLALLQEQEFGRRQSAALAWSGGALADTAAAEAAAGIGHVGALTVLAALALEALLDAPAAHPLGRDPANLLQLHRVLTGPGWGGLEAHAPVLLAWGCLLCLLHAAGLLPPTLAPATADPASAPPHAALTERHYSRGLSFAAGALEAVRQGPNALGAQAVGRGLLACVLSAFAAPPTVPPLLQLHVQVFRDAPPLAADFWAHDRAHPALGSLLDRAEAVFPLQLEPLLLLLAPLASDAASARRAYDESTQLRVCCTAWADVVPFCQTEAGPDPSPASSSAPSSGAAASVSVLQPFALWGLSFPARARGTLLPATAAGAEAVLWRLAEPYSAWRCVAARLRWLAEALAAGPLSRPAHLEAVLQALPPAARALQLALRLLTCEDAALAAAAYRHLDRQFAELARPRLDPPADEAPLQPGGGLVAHLLALIEGTPLLGALPAPCEPAAAVAGAALDCLAACLTAVPRALQAGRALDLSVPALLRTALQELGERDEGVPAADAEADVESALRLLAAAGAAQLPGFAALLRRPTAWEACLLAAPARVQRLLLAAAALLEPEGPVWRLVRARAQAGLLPALRAALRAHETLLGRYPVTRGALALLGGAAPWLLARERGSELAPWLPYVRSDLLASFDTWRYARMEDKWALGAALLDVVLLMLRTPPPAPALAPAQRQRPRSRPEQQQQEQEEQEDVGAVLLRSLLGDSSFHAVLLGIAGVGRRRLERLHAARQLLAARELQRLTERALAVLEAALSASPPAAGPSPLLQALMSRSTGGVAGSEYLLQTVALYALYAHSAALPRHAARILALASAGRGTRAGMLVGYLGAHVDLLAAELCRRAADRASSAPLRLALLDFLATALRSQPGLIPHLLREQPAGSGSYPLIETVLALVSDEAQEPAVRTAALGAWEAAYAASPELLQPARVREDAWRALLRPLVPPSAGLRGRVQQWPAQAFLLRAQLLRLLALEAVFAAQDSVSESAQRVQRALDAPLAELLAAGPFGAAPDALEAALCRHVEPLLRWFRDEGIAGSDRLRRALQAEHADLPRVAPASVPLSAAPDGAPLEPYDVAALERRLGPCSPAVDAASRWNRFLGAAAALETAVAAAARLLIVAQARAWAPLASRCLAGGRAGRLVSFVVHLFDGALAEPGTDRSAYPLLPLGLPTICPFLSAITARLVHHLAELLLHLLRPPGGAAVLAAAGGAVRLLHTLNVLLQRALSLAQPPEPLLEVLEGLLLLVLGPVRHAHAHAQGEPALRDVWGEVARSGALEALVASQARLLAAGAAPSVTGAALAVLHRLQDPSATPYLVALGVLDRLAALLAEARAACNEAAAASLLTLLVAVAADPDAAESLVRRGLLHMLAAEGATGAAGPEQSGSEVWGLQVALVTRLVLAGRPSEALLDGLQQWLRAHRPALLAALSPPLSAQRLPLHALLQTQRVAALFGQLARCAKRWRPAAPLALSEEDVVALLQLVVGVAALVQQPSVLQQIVVAGADDDRSSGAAVQAAERHMLAALRSALQALLAVCSSRPYVPLLLPYPSSTPPAHLADSPYPTMGTVAEWLDACGSLLGPGQQSSEAPRPAAVPRGQEVRALLHEIVEASTALLLLHCRLFLARPDSDALRSRFRKEVVPNVETVVTRLLAHSVRAQKEAPLSGAAADTARRATEFLERARELLGLLKRRPPDEGEAPAQAPHSALRLVEANAGPSPAAAEARRSVYT